MTYAAGRDFRSNVYNRTQVRSGEGQAGKAALERQIVAHPDFTVNPPIFAMPHLMAGENFAAYYGVPLTAKGVVNGVLEIFHRAPLHPDNEWLNFLETLGGQVAIAIDSATMFNDLHRSNFELSTAYNATIAGWSRALDLRDKETEGHTQRVTEMTMRLARTMGLSDDELMQIQRGAHLRRCRCVGCLAIRSSLSPRLERRESARLHPRTKRHTFRPASGRGVYEDVGRDVTHKTDAVASQDRVGL